MKTFAIILAILITSCSNAQSFNAQLDTVYLEDKKAWDFYIDMNFLINDRRRYNMDVLMDNDPKHRDAFYVIDNVVYDNVNPESIIKPLIAIGVRGDYLARYKVFFLQQMTGAYYPPGSKNRSVEHNIPDNLMYVIDKKTKMLKFMKCWNFEIQYDHRPENIAGNRQTIEKDVFDVLQIHMNEFAKLRYKAN
jgi:hypothetical protein